LPVVASAEGPVSRVLKEIEFAVRKNQRRTWTPEWKDQWAQALQNKAWAELDAPVRTTGGEI